MRKHSRITRGYKQGMLWTIKNHITSAVTNGEEDLGSEPVINKNCFHSSNRQYPQLFVMRFSTLQK